MKGRFSFRKGLAYDGMRRLPEAYEFRRGGVRLANLQEHRDGGWFWYGDNINSAHRLDTLENVKAEVLAHFKGKAEDRR